MTDPTQVTTASEVRGPATDSFATRRRGFLETKPFAMASEFWLTVAGIAAVLIAGYRIDDGAFTLYHAWMLATVIASAYIVSRGLAKSGTSHDPYTDHQGR